MPQIVAYIKPSVEHQTWTSNDEKILQILETLVSKNEFSDISNSVPVNECLEG